MHPSPVCSTALTEDLVQAVESALGEDDEATHVATRSQLQQVQALNGADLNTRQVPADGKRADVCVCGRLDRGGSANGACLAGGALLIRRKAPWPVPGKHRTARCHDNGASVRSRKPGSDRDRDSSAAAAAVSAPCRT